MVFKDVVHECRERARQVRQPEEHDCWFEQAAIGSERCLPFVTSLDMDVVVTPPNVECREDRRILESIHEFRNQWERVPILHRDLVETAVVLNGTQTAVLLLDKEEG